jgi:hypothetical protein
VLDHTTTYDADARMGGVAIRRGRGMCVRRHPQALRSVARAAACAGDALLPLPKPIVRNSAGRQIDQRDPYRAPSSPNRLACQLLRRGTSTWRTGIAKSADHMHKRVNPNAKLPAHADQTGLQAHMWSRNSRIDICRHVRIRKLIPRPEAI